MHSPSFHLPQFWERGETDPCPRPRAPVIDLFSAKRERSQPRHATATGMIKLPVRAWANATRLGERRIRRCGAAARCHRADATQQRRFTLNWRWDGMMCFALLVSRAFCHCSCRGGGGQGCARGKLAAPGAAPRNVRRAAGPSNEGEPIPQADLRPFRRLPESSAYRPRVSDTGAGKCRLRNRTCSSSEADSCEASGWQGRGFACLLRAYQADSAETAISAPRCPAEVPRSARCDPPRDSGLGEAVPDAVNSADPPRIARVVLDLPA